MDFSKKLIIVRAKLNLSQTDLGKLLNVSFVTISRWENNKARPTKRVLYAFARKSNSSTLGKERL